MTPLPRGQGVSRLPILILCLLALPLAVQARDPARATGAASPSTVQALYRVNREKPADYAQVPLNRLIPARVIRVTDGDTFQIEAAALPALAARWPEGFDDRETVRLLGVDTPEIAHGKRKADALGPEAADFTRAALTGRTVYLAFDWDLRDRYGRLLCYAYLADGSLFNARLIEEGLSAAYVEFRFAFSAAFLGLEAQARGQRRGLWRQPLKTR